MGFTAGFHVPLSLRVWRLYGATKTLYKRIEVNETRMVVWMCRVTRSGMYTNEGQPTVTQATTKITERRLDWNGYVMRRDEEHILGKVLRTDITGKRKRARPTQDEKIHINAT